MKFFWLRNIFTGIFLFIAALLALIMVQTNPEPWTPAEIKKITIGLNEAAAIGVPHGFLMGKAER